MTNFCFMNFFLQIFFPVPNFLEKRSIIQSALLKRMLRKSENPLLFSLKRTHSSAISTTSRRKSSRTCRRSLCSTVTSASSWPASESSTSPEKCLRPDSRPNLSSSRPTRSWIRHRSRSLETLPHMSIWSEWGILGGVFF